MDERKSIVILISGRGSNMKAIADNVKDGCLKGICTIRSVFSNRPDAPGLQTARESGLETRVIDSRGKKRSTYNKLLLEYLQELNPDLIVLAGYMKILPASIVQTFPERIINIHPADTSFHQGLHGYEWAYRNNMSETMITVHYVDEGLDTGKVIAKQKVDLSRAENLEEVEQAGLKVEHRFYSRCINKILAAEKKT